jgi:quinol monooxygenase YgiN
MRTVIRALPALVVATLAAMPAHAQAPEGPRYVATYVEVMPTAANEGADLVRAFRDASRHDAGNLRVEAAQRIGQPNQFVILESWQDQASLDAHAKAGHTTAFRDNLKPIEDAPPDDRVNTVLSIGPGPANLGTAAILAVTHVDVVPPQRDSAATLLKTLAEDSRKQDGNAGFEALTQVSRPNHFTVVAAWRDSRAADAHAMNTATQAFRQALAPMAGALYDERFYKPLD